MLWFGESWGAPVCDLEHTATPEGWPCAWCSKNIGQGQQGLLVPIIPFGLDDTDMVMQMEGVPHVAYHLACMTRMVVGT